MIKVTKIIMSILISALCGQVSTQSTPKSLQYNIPMDISIEKLDEFDVQDFIEEDKSINNLKTNPYRFANSIEVNFNMNNSGKWIKANDGTNIWRLIIQSKNAYSLNAIYDKFHIPKGSEFFVYSYDKEMILGAFTDYNHKPHGGFSTAPVKGDMIVFEYNEPVNAEFRGQISIKSIAHDYRNMFFNNRGYGDSGSCNNNVECDVGNEWRNEIRSVAMILTSGGSRICTGSLVNNTRQDLTPYFLTANHCLGGNDSWIFMFNYQSATCTNQNGPTNMTVSGSTLLANSSSSDFALLELNENPPLDYNVHYAGWDAGGNTPVTPVGIHHPSGDIKKISFDYNNATNSGNYWDVDSWDDGTTEPGSSGSPLFDGNTQRIIGQLYGGVASCTNFGYDTYGKISTSWDLGMNNYLDPDNTGQNYVNGIDAIDLPDPLAVLDVGNLSTELNNGQNSSTQIRISNNGEEESVLTYSLKITPFNAIGGNVDDGGYWWTDSDISSELNTNWIDISDNSTQVIFPNNDVSGDPIELGFDFPFYGQSYSDLIINANGWIGFGQDNSNWENIDIPSATAPKPAIFPFWDDLNPSNDNCNQCSGEVYYSLFPDKIVVWFNNVSHWPGASYTDSNFDFQTILYKDGRINIHYNTINGNFSPTIGMQDESGTVGQKIMYESTFVSSGWVDDNKSLNYAQSPNWNGINNIGNHEFSGELGQGEIQLLNILFENNDLASGEYYSYVNFSSNGNLSQAYPISLISLDDTSNLGDLNSDGELNILDVVQLVNIILYGSNDSYLLNVSDINQDENVNVLDIVQLVNLILI